MQGVSPEQKRVAHMLRAVLTQKHIVQGEFDSSASRLPPGQSWVRRGFPVLDLGIHPEIGLDEWRLIIDGVGVEPLELTYQDLLALPVSALIADIHCVTAWSVQDAVWHGVFTKDLLQAPIDPRITHVLVHSSDGYSANLPIDAFLAPGCMLAIGLSGDKSVVD